MPKAKRTQGKGLTSMHVGMVVLAVIIAVALIYSLSGQGNDPAVGSSVPSKVRTTSDLQVMETSLESANLDSVSAELDANEADLTSF
jgi:hypothetical protein